MKGAKDTSTNFLWLYHYTYFSDVTHLLRKKVLI